MVAFLISERRPQPKAKLQGGKETLSFLILVSYKSSEHHNDDEVAVLLLESETSSQDLREAQVKNISEF